MLLRTVLAFAGATTVAVLFWFLRGSSDSAVLQAKDAQIAAIHDTIQAKDGLASQQSGLIDARNASIKELQDNVKSDEDLLAKNRSQIDADKAELERVKKADETIINSLKEDNNSDIQSLKDQIQTKDDQIAQLNERLVQTINDYENKLNAMRTQVASAPDDTERIYPLDDGFEQENLGAGFLAYQLFGPIKNPQNAPMPNAIPKSTSWTFGGSNAGIATNGCGMYLTNARNANHDGNTSQTGQAAFLQFKGGWFSQTVKLPSGTYSVSFDYEARRDYGEADGIAVSLDATDLLVGAPTDTDHFTRVTTNTITLTATKEYELKFRGLGAISDPDGDHTTFIDNVCINVINPSKHSPKKITGTSSTAANGRGE
jgi:hypothetical protein